MRYFLLLLCLLPALLYAQDCQNPQKYQEKILAADSCIQAGNFRLAYDNYSAAQIYCRDSAGVVEEAKAALFEKINGLRVHAQKLVDAFYFYEGQYALAYGEKDYKKVFYFINKNGDAVDKLRRWEKAEQFDVQLGFSRVMSWDGTHFLMDTSGQIYKVAYTVEDLNDEMLALDLRGTNLKEFPSQVFNYPQLKILILDRSHYGPKLQLHLPESIGKLKELEVLSLKSCKLRTLPAEIGQLSQLKSLHLNQNLLTSLPSEIGQLKRLEHLKLDYNRLESIPTTFGKLASLKQLDLKVNQISKLPPAFFQLTQLEQLSLQANQLTSLSPQIGQFKKLTHLDISYNQISNLPAEIGELQNLTHFNTGGNHLTHLPPPFKQLKHLKELDLYNNQLIQIASFIKDLRSLEQLSFTGNPINVEELLSIRALALAHNIDINYNSLASSFVENGQYAQAYHTLSWALPESSGEDTQWYNLSFYALFANRPEEAITAARKTLELEPEAIGVATNLALGYLLNGRYDKAEPIYLKWKGKQFPDDERLWDEVFLQDIAELEAAGINHPDFAKAKALFKK